LLVNEKFAGAATPDTVAATLYGPPATALAVNVGAVAIPDAFVDAFATKTLPGKLPDAPDPGAVNVTEKLGITTLAASLTIACNAVPKSVPTVAL
jgi:hypothetical protein